jgi:CDP-diacylglycerol--serine O-phosphatidyltransferase
MKQIPNIFTLLNLIFGCIAIVLILQTGESIVILDSMGATQVTLPEKIWQGSLFIFGAAIIDFLDGFLARLLKANSEKGKQLDSLCDVVSFGVAPGMILYQLLRIGYAQGENGLDVSVIALLPAFIFSAAVACRLAKFNISTNQSYSFRGVPCPAAGLLIASFPLIIWYQYYNIQQLFINVWLLYAVILIVSFLMVSNLPFMALKFTDYSLKNNWIKYLLLLLSVICILTLHWLAVPVIFVLYILFSLFAKEPPPMVADTNRATLDVTV